MAIWTDWLAKWKHILLYPYLRRKDAGYIANVLSEYASFPVDARRERLKDGRFDEVERCYAALLIARDEDAKAEDIRLGQLRQALEQAAAGVSPQADPIEQRVWLQGYMRQVFVVEKAVLELQAFPELIARAPLMLERFRNLADQKADFLKRQYDQDLSADKLSKLWEEWTKAGTGAAQTPGESWLRGKMVALLNDIHWWYGQSQVREELFLGQQIALIGTFLFGALALLSAGTYFTGSCNGKAYVAVMFFGMLGAFVSVMRRMRNDVEQHGGGAESSYKELTALAYGKIGITSALVFGAVFALILMLLFEAELTQSIFNAELAKLLFPQKPFLWMNCTPNSTGVLACVRLNATNAARALLWSFVAGFAEQLVPDALDRLTKAAQPKQSGK